MLEKIKKYKFIILFSLIFLFFICINNNVNANVDINGYNFPDIPSSLNGDDVTEYFIYKDNSGTFRLHITSGDSVKVVVSNCNSTKYFYRFKNNSNNDGSEGRYYLNGSSWVYSNGGFDGWDLKYNTFICSTIDIYFDSNLIFNANISNFIFPQLHIEYNENTSSYWCWSAWYNPVSFGVINPFIAYGEYSSFTSFIDPEDYWNTDDNDFTEFRGSTDDGTYEERVGFELWHYGIYSFCMYNVRTNDWIINKIDFTENALKGTDAEGCLDSLNNLNLYLDNTTGIPTVYSNFFEKSILDSYSYYDFSVSFDNGETFSSVVIDNKEERIAEDTSYIRFYYKLYTNDTYTLKLTIYDEEHKKHEIIKNFTIDSNEEIIDSVGTDKTPATPFISAYADSSIIRLYTQTFKERISINYFEDTSVDTLRYDAYYIDAEAYKLFGDNYEDWIIMDVAYEEYDKTIQAYPYYYKTEWSYDNIQDGTTLYFVFYDKKLGCFSSVSIYTLESKADLLTLSQNITFNNDKFNRLYKFFEEHFGFLFYPLDFMINFFNRLFNVQFEEPILHIPTVNIPNSNQVLINGFDFNFNSVLENKAVATVYNIYLIAVDFIIVVSFAIGAKNTLEEVLLNG